MAKSWLKIASRLKRLIDAVGELWPKSTKLAGYGTDGPYFCGMCEYLKGIEKDNVFKDGDGLGRCRHPMMIRDSEVKKDSQGRPIVNIEKGCCEFVEKYEKKLVQIEKKI
jgi:hypothetical protein